MNRPSNGLVRHDAPMCLSRTMGVTLWLFNIAMENGPFIVGLPMKMVIFHGYVK